MAVSTDSAKTGIGGGLPSGVTYSGVSGAGLTLAAGGIEVLNGETLRWNNGGLIASFGYSGGIWTFTSQISAVPLIVNAPGTPGDARNGILIQPDGHVSWGTDPNLSGLRTSLRGEASGVLAQRDSTTAQTFRIYNTYTDSSNYERISLSWASNVAYLLSEAAGTGTKRLLLSASGVTTVAALPAASAALAGARAMVSDANSTTFNAAAVGGGANIMGVICKGAGGWFIG